MIQFIIGIFICIMLVIVAILLLNSRQIAVDSVKKNQLQQKLKELQKLREEAVISTEIESLEAEIASIKRKIKKTAP